MNRSCFITILILQLILAGSIAKAKMTCHDETICIEKKQEGNQISFTGVNLKAQMPVTGKFSFFLMGMEIAKGTDGPFVLDGGERRELLTLIGSEDGQWQYHQTFQWVRGDFRKSIENKPQYHLPFAPGASFKVLQGCDSNFTHRDHDAKSVDFDMPVGMAVHAARAGIVVDLKEDSLIGGSNPALRLSGNKIIIEHSDGTMAQYGHLAHQGAEVVLGETVEAGQLIGYSGNTGYSSHPHLHFGVTAASDEAKAISLLTPFQTTDGTVVCPEVGKILTRPQGE